MHCSSNSKFIIMGACGFTVGLRLGDDRRWHWIRWWAYLIIIETVRQRFTVTRDYLGLGNAVWTTRICLRCFVDLFDCGEKIGLGCYRTRFDRGRLGLKAVFVLNETLSSEDLPFSSLPYLENIQNRGGCRGTILVFRGFDWTGYD